VSLPETVVVAAAAAIAAARAAASAVVASVGGSESPGAAAGRADGLGEPVMLNSRSKESTTRCIAVCVDCSGCMRKRARGIPRYLWLPNHL